MIHTMLDLESFGHTGRRAGAICQIGACKWNIKTGEIKSEFLVNVQADTERFAYEYATLRWWFGQSQAAQRALFVPEPISLEEGLRQFAGWYTSGSRSDGLWSHASFDTATLGAAYNTYGIPVPWAYRGTKDIRTLNWLAQELGVDLRALPRATATLEHNGLADAIEQAKDVTTVLNAIRGRTAQETA